MVLVNVTAAKAAHADAARAFVDLNRDVVEQHVKQLRKIVGVPLSRATGALLLDGIRMSMFFACETGDETTVERCVDEIFEHSRRKVGGEAGIAVIPDIALSWAYGWRDEIDGDHQAALSQREWALVKPDPARRARELRQKSGNFTGADATEARLLVDCFADLVRSIRVCRPWVSTMGPIRSQLVDPLAASVFLDLAADSRMSFWSRRRTLTRAAFEMADRPDTPQLRTERKKLLHRIEKQDPRGLRDSRLAELDTRLIAIERMFAWAHSTTVIDFKEVEECREHAKRLFAQYDFDRRIRALDALWPLILAHGPST
jgi:hypothetical protein